MTTTPTTEKPSYVTTTGASRIDDPNVKLPKAVQQGAAAANELHAQNYKKEVDATPGATPAAQSDPPSPAPDAAPAAPAGQEDWEHKFNSVNGRYVKSQQTIQNLNGRISDLESALAARDSQPASTPKPVQSELTEQEVNDYGEEFLNVVGKKAREIAASEISRLNDRIEQLTNQLNGVTTTVVKDAKQKMMENLDASIPNWRAINNNEDFLTWLGLKDPYSGTIRHTMLKEAWDRNDTSRVKNFFNGFITDEAVVTPQGDQTAQVAPEVTKPPLTQFAAPGRASNTGGNNTPPASTKPIITRAQIAAFHQDVARGRYRGREAEQKAFDVAMIEAAREGRIR